MPKHSNLSDYSKNGSRVQAAHEPYELLLIKDQITNMHANQINSINATKHQYDAMMNKFPGENVMATGGRVEAPKNHQYLSISEQGEACSLPESRM